MKKTIFQWVIYILLFIWQLPQNLLSLIMILIFKLSKKNVEFSIYKDEIYVWIIRWYNGVSLGNFILLDKEYYEHNLDTINHEYGHSIQSKILGPLYLPIIGVLSGGWNLIDRLLRRCCKTWTYNKAYKVYYSMPWEHTADLLGGVKRNYNF